MGKLTESIFLCVGRIKCYKNSAVGCLNSSTINNLSIYEYIHRFT